MSSIEESLVGSDSSARAIVCEKEGTPIGYAVYFFNYSTWLGKHGLYLEDLYVSPSEHGSGAGKILLKHLPVLSLLIERTTRLNGRAFHVVDTSDRVH